MLNSIDIDLILDNLLEYVVGWVMYLEETCYDLYIGPGINLDNSIELTKIKIKKD